MYELGCLYLAGECTDIPIGPCLTKAKNWFHAAAEQGYKDAGEQEKKVKGLYSGLGSYAYLVSSKHTAWMEKMAENGNGHACLNVGRFRAHEHNYEEAFELFRRGADAGNRDCALECGLACRNGAGVEKDDRQAFQWFKKAAMQGSEDAMYQCGVCYLDGLGMEKDQGKAVQWFRRAAKGGSSKAVSALKHLGEKV